MLERLDTVDWASLTHAYGPATDVPSLLRSLLFPGKEERDEALSELFGNIWHQGTVYPATAAAVPFLYELLAGADTPDKSGIAALLACIADGVGYLEGELERERAEIASVHRAVSAGLHHLFPYLRDSDADLRRLVAVALGNYAEHAVISFPALEVAEASESDEHVLEGLRESKARLSSARA